MPSDQPSILRVKNWERYQVYKDGRPVKFVALWIVTEELASGETRTGVLDNPDFLRLANEPGCPVFRLLALAGRLHNRIPNDPGYLQGVLHCGEIVNVTRLLEAGFLEAHPDAQIPVVQNRTDSYVPSRSEGKLRFPSEVKGLGWKRYIPYPDKEQHNQ